MWNVIWKSNVMPRVKMFSWRLVARAVAVRDGLVRRGLQVGVGCPMCAESETVEHLILGCAWVHGVWQALLGLREANDGCATVSQWLSKRWACLAGAGSCDIRWQCVLTACWAI